jgi:hypothetical protein
MRNHKSSFERTESRRQQTEQESFFLAADEFGPFGGIKVREVALHIRLRCNTLLRDVTLALSCGRLAYSRRAPQTPPAQYGVVAV